MLPLTRWTNENGLNPKFGNDCLFYLYQNQMYSVEQKHRGYNLCFFEYNLDSDQPAYDETS